MSKYRSDELEVHQKLLSLLWMSAVQTTASAGCQMVGVHASRGSREEEEGPTLCV